MILPILKFPDNRLRLTNSEVTDFGEPFQKLVDNMEETMVTANGIGLAAPQVGKNIKMFILGMDGLLVFANPILSFAGEQVPSKEGCLSFPRSNEWIKRSENIQVRAQDRQGEWFELEATGLLAMAIQHEYDHLNGVLLIDKIDSIRQRFLRKKIRS